MQTQQNNSNWTIREIRGVIVGNLEPRHAGGADARHGRPAPNNGYLPPYLHSCQTSAQALLVKAQERADEEFAGETAKIRQCPLALEPPNDAIRSVPIQTESRSTAELEHDKTTLADARERAEESDVAYGHQRQMSGANKPPGAWAPTSEAVLAALFIVLVDAFIGYRFLTHAVGAERAVVSCVVLAFISFCSGGLSAWLLLRPTDYRLDTIDRRRVRWTIGLLIAVLNLLILYVGACYRAAWIDGQAGLPNEVWAKFESPRDVLMRLEILALLFIGLVGYGFGAWECTRYFRGYGPALREAAIENERALLARNQIARRARARVQSAVGQAHATIDALREQAEAWVQRIPTFREEAALVAKEANRCREATARLLSDVCAEYADGYHEVRGFDRSKATTCELAYPPIEVPTPFDSACDTAVLTIQGASAATSKAHLDVDQLRVRLIARIDQWSGLRSESSNLPRIPEQE